MTRIGVVVTRFIAGAGGVAFRGAQALDPAEYEVTVMAATGGTLLARAAEAGLDIVRLRHMRHDIAPADDIRCLGELTDVIRSRRFDIVHTHSAKAGALGRIAARRAGVRGVVHTFHGFPFHEFQRWPTRRAYLAAERRLARETDYFLAVGSDVAAEAVRLGIAPPDRIRVIAPAIDLDAIRPPSRAARDEARLRLHLPRRATVVGTVGRLAPQKAPERMLEAFRRLDFPDLYFVWIGGGPLSRRMERLVTAAGMEGRFRLAGERPDVAELLPGLDVFAMSSLYEGLPCALVEAMAVGVPVVATAVNAVPELVVPGRTGILVPPNRPVPLARAIDHMLRCPDDARRMAIAARGRLGADFSASTLGLDLDHVYQLVLAGGERHVVPDLRLDVAE